MNDQGITVDIKRIQEVVHGLEQELPGWDLDCVLMFGSTARDEAVAGSDVDLWFIGHAPDRIFLDKTWRQGRFAAGTERFLVEYTGLEVVDIDSWGDLQGKVGLSMPLVFGSPLADTRWLLWQLAEEREWQCLFFSITGQAVIDPSGFLPALHEFMWNERPFHVSPRDGIVSTIKRACEEEKFALLRDLASVSGQEVVGPEAEHTAWLWPAVECIRDTVVLLTLVQDGRPLFRRREVLAFIEREFPQHVPVAEAVYWYKATEAGREAWDALLGEGFKRRERELRPLTEGVVAFWHTAMVEVDRCLLEGKSRIPLAGENWQEKNRVVYGRFLDDYLAKKV